ncbi:hypothetical protein KIW84_035261 [Lathyrus oleraceus]|uniref:Uncharacterized protein n=1 Tax=Pisum sativum TaxID=3888 RepID=A0A9D4Y656_PEA|nr:hypothetical protein KIW84_035261 [Pisum sativum]
MIQHHLPILNSLYSRQRKMMLKGIPDEITRLLEYEKKIIRLYHENQQNSQTGALQMKKKEYTLKAKLTDAEWIQSRYDQLNLIEEKRLTAMCHGQLYQQRMKKAFDKKVKPRVFREGDLVLKKVLSFASDSRGKWTPNYEGPYVVKRAFSGGVLMLTTMDGEDFTRPVNSDAVKRYFA